MTGYTHWIRFTDGAAGEADRSPDFRGEVIEPFEAVACFNTFPVHSELRTGACRNGPDFAPEQLRSAMRAAARPFWFD